MSLIQDEQKERIKNQLAQDLVAPVRVIMFTQQMECEFCVQTKQLITKVADLNDEIRAEVRDFVADSELAKQFGVDKVPAIVLLGEKDYGIRFYGMPYGYEFQTFMSTLAIVSKGGTDLSEGTRARVGAVAEDVFLKQILQAALQIG